MAVKMIHKGLSGKKDNFFSYTEFILLPKAKAFFISLSKRRHFHFICSEIRSQILQEQHTFDK